MPDDYLARKTRKLVRLFKRYRKQGFSPETLLQTGDFNEAQDLGREIINYLLWHPGSLVCFRNYHEMKEAEQAIEVLWEYWDHDQVFSDLLSGEFGGLHGYLSDRYAERARLLRPVCTLSRTRPEVRAYLKQAMRAWAHGLDVACVILCWSVIEELLREKLTKANERPSCDRRQWIASAKRNGWLDAETSKSANRIRKLRNKLVHKTRRTHPRHDHNVIIDTKEVVERLLQ